MTTKKQKVHKRWYLKNRDKVLSYGGVYYRNNRDAILAYQFDYRNENPMRFMLNRARLRAKSKGWKFTITQDDVKMVTHCPILKMKLTYKRDGTGKIPKNLATIDRINPRKGYIPDNVQIISWRANDLKKDITFKEMKELGDYYLKMGRNK